TSKRRISSSASTDGEMPKLYRTLRETPEFAEHMDALGDIKQIDEALNAVTWALATDPQQFPAIPGTSGLRLARTVSYQRGDVFVPGLKIWFVILADGAVELRMVTRDEPDDEIF